MILSDGATDEAFSNLGNFTKEDLPGDLQARSRTLRQGSLRRRHVHGPQSAAWHGGPAASSKCAASTTSPRRDRSFTTSQLDEAMAEHRGVR